MKNSVTLMGRPGAEPEMRNLSNNQKMARFSLAVNEGRMNANKEWVENTQWFNLVAWGNTADQVMRCVHKGKMIAIQGTLRNNDWLDKDKVRHYATEVWLNEVFSVETEKAQN